MKLGLAEGTSDARGATFSSNRKKINPAFRSKKSHDPNAKRPEGRSNAGERRKADVPRGFTRRSENPAPPETGVIDTLTTSETGSAAFVELRPSQHRRFSGAALECKRRPPSRLGLTVPADQAVERGHHHSTSTFGGEEAIAHRSCSVVPHSPPVTKHSAYECGRDIHHPQSEKLPNQGVPVVDYSNNVLDYENGVPLPPTCVAGQAKLTATACDSNCHATNPSLLGIYSQLGSVMSTSEASREFDKHVRVYGTKVSQLKRFFDSCASSSCEASLEFEEQNLSLPDAQCAGQGVNTTTTNSMECYQQQVDNAVEQTLPIVNESDSFLSTVKTNTEDKQNNVNSSVERKHSILLSGAQESASNGVEYEGSGEKHSFGETGNGLWENIRTDKECGVLWKGFESNSFSGTDCAELPVDPLTLSTAELNTLIAASRAELSKIVQPQNSRSTLESYFTSIFDSDRLNNHVSHNKLNNEVLDSDQQQTEPLGNQNLSSNDNGLKKTHHSCESYSKNCDLCYECDVGEIAFDDVDDAVLSDTSSEEEAHFSSLSSNAHYQQAAYSLHTIIEESCEESERDSRSVTPTNLEPTSKLERYFSWDIINDSELKRIDVEDSSTIFSDSLSEDSGSLTDINKEVEPSHLASSRLEKYFTSGLLGNDNYLYPDDAEFLEDMPVSDFEEENVHKISRSALLNSLELGNSVNIQNNLSSKDDINELSVCNENCGGGGEDSDIGDECSDSLHNLGFNRNSSSDLERIGECVKENANLADENVCSPDDNFSLNELHSEVASPNCKNSNLDREHNIQNIDNSADYAKEVSSDGSELEVNTKNKLKHISEKEYFDESAQAIMKKIIVHLSDSSCPVGKEESNYYSAWKILETEIERMMQTVSPHLDHPNYNGSTIDSNNSDYGSDTVESVECLTTDEDDNCVEGKLQNSNSTEVQDPVYSTNRNSFISEETLDIWRKLMVSLKKDTLSLSQQDNCDEYTKARLYIRDQIIALMHTVTSSQTNSPSENRKKSVGAPRDGNVEAVQDANSSIVRTPEKICDATVNDDLPSSLASEDKVQLCLTVDEGISVDSTESISVDNVAVEGKQTSEMQEVDNKSLNGEVCIPPLDKEHQQVSIPSEIFLDLSYVLQQEEVCKVPDQEGASDDHSGENAPCDSIGYLSDSEINACSSLKESCGGDNSSQFSVYVDIQLDNEKATVTERRCAGSEISAVDESADEVTKRSSVHLWLNSESAQPSPTSDHSPFTNDISVSPHIPSQNITSSNTETKSAIVDIPVYDKNQCLKVEETPICAATSRDTGYYSFKSSEDSILSISDSGNQQELAETSGEKEIYVHELDHRSPGAVSSPSKENGPLNLSLSANNIPETISCAETKFCTLPPKPTTSKVSMHPLPSVPATSRFFSPSAAFKKLATSKNYAVPSEMTIPSKYLKKYARSSSVDDESLFGAASMPHLSTPNLNESHYLTADSDRESSLTLDDDTDTKRKYSSSSHSVLSLGSHSASMTSVYSAAGGRHFGYVTVSGDVLFGLNYNQKSQMMEVFVKQCRNLAAVDTKRNKSDPYVKVYLLPDKTKGGKRKTKTKKSTLNPIFNELLRFPVLKHELESRTLWLSVWNSDLFGRNDFLGEVMLALGYRLLDSPTLRWYPLQERSESPASPLNYKGELFLALKYVPRDLSLESRFRPAPVISLRGALHILVKEARNIMAMRSNGTSDPFCKSYLLPDKSKNSKQKTPIVKRTRHPKWYYTVVYEDLSVEELKERSLELTLWDHDKLTSNEFMGGIRLNTATGLYHGVPVEWMDARRDEAALWQAMLERPNMWVDGSLPLRPTMQFIRN